MHFVRLMLDSQLSLVRGRRDLHPLRHMICDPFNVASITSPRDPCLLTLGRPVRPSGTGTMPSRCHCMKVETVATLKDFQTTCTIFNVAADVLYMYETDRKKVTSTFSLTIQVSTVHVHVATYVRRPLPHNSSLAT